MSYPYKNLGDVAEIITGSTPSTENQSFWGGRIPFVTPSELGDSFHLGTSSAFVTELGASAARPVPRNAVLVCCIGSLGKVGVTSERVVINQQINAIVFDESVVDHRFGFHYCKTLKPLLEHMAPSTTIPIVNKGRFSKITIPLPPLEEQKRIAAILDKADSLRRKRQQAIRLADDFLRAVFLDMFGDLQLNSKGWDSVPLGDLIQGGPTNGLYCPSDMYGSGTPILRIDGFYDGRLLPDYQFKRVRIDEKTQERYCLRENSIVVNRVNSREFVGKAAYVGKLAEPTVFESNMMNLKLTPVHADHVFIVEQMRMPYIRAQIATARKDAVNQSSVNQDDIRNLAVRLPPLDLQTAFRKAYEKHGSLQKLYKQFSNEADAAINALQASFFA